MKDYVFLNDYSLNTDATVSTCGYETCKPGHNYGPVYRSSYHIHYVLDGCGIFKVGDKVYHLKQYDAFFIAPDDLIYYEADSEDPWTYTWIGFHGARVRQYLTRTSLFEQPVFSYSQDDFLKDLHEKMYQAYRHPTNNDLLLTGILFEYFFFLAGTLPGTQQERIRQKQNHYIDEAVNYMITYYDRPITIQDVADSLGIGRTYLHRLFKERTSQSLKDYLQDYRIAQACKYLLTTDLPIGDIARSIGYEDALYFSRMFRKRKGMAPSDYRRRSEHIGEV